MSDTFAAASKRDAWEESYRRLENYVFSPAEEVVRFVSRYLRKRTGLSSYVDLLPGIGTARILDAGCGIGRNIVFGRAMGLKLWGIDLSLQATETAKAWLHLSGFGDSAELVVQGDMRELPWGDGYFDHVLSDSALDSMSGDIVRAGTAELARVLKPGGLFYCNLISGQQTGLPAEFADDQVVDTTHEKGTIQAYYNLDRIHELFDFAFTFEEIALTRRQDVLRSRFAGRWHVVLRRK